MLDFLGCGLLVYGWLGLVLSLATDPVPVNRGRINPLQAISPWTFSSFSQNSAQPNWLNSMAPVSSVDHDKGVTSEPFKIEYSPYLSSHNPAKYLSSKSFLLGQKPLSPSYESCITNQSSLGFLLFKMLCFYF